MYLGAVPSFLIARSHIENVLEMEDMAIRPDRSLNR